MLALAGWLSDDHRLSPLHTAADYAESLGEMYDANHLRALTTQAVERGEVDQLRWPTLVREVATRVFAAPAAPAKGGDAPGG